MKRILLLSLIALSLFFARTNVFAVCEDKELNDWAEDVEILFQEDVSHLYETLDENGNKVLKEYVAEYYYKLLICTPREDVTVKVTDTENTKEYNAINSDFDNSYIINSYLHFKAKTYTFKIYANDSSSCPGELLKTLKYTVPAYNKYVGTEFCEQNPNEEICQADYDSSKIEEEKIDKIMDSVIEKNKISSMSFFEKALYYVGKYWFYVVIPIIVVAIVYFVKIRVYKKKGEIK
ncbi:MAG: hypothetical protein GX758_03500 [Tenericutes bacterium]|nr:hypothetical protein [Mycoplasmatota bacterium]